MIPAKAKVNIYRSSTNGFMFEFNQPDGTNFDLGLFEKVEAVLFLRGDRFNSIDTFDMQTVDNVASLSFTPEQTEELFKANAYSFEIRMYDSETSFLVYVVVDLNFLDVFRPDGKVHGATVVVDENETATVTMSESSVFAALAQNAAQQSQQLLNDLETIRDQLQPIIDNQTELISLSQVEGLDTLANKIAEVEAVANNIANVVSVGENIGAVTDVQAITTQLLAVHERLTEVQAVGDNIANVNTVSHNITAVNTAANNIQAIIDAPDFASDAEKHAQKTISFQDSDNVNFEKGAKGWSQNAESSATASGQSAQSASTSESNAASSASAASDSATASEQSRQASESARDDSQSARDKSQQWAEQSEDVEVDPGQFSSLHHARKSEESATAASESASNAAESETNAASSASSAESFKDQTETLFDQFGSQYLGSKESDPTTDNDGDPLTAGDIYFNTTDEVLKFYSGTAWVAPEDVATTAANNAEQSAQAASESETNAAQSEQNAAQSETNAGNSADAAAASETSAGQSETSASQSASSASTSASNASDSETNAAQSEEKAGEWADNDRNVPVENDPDKFSSKHWAKEAEDSASTFKKVEEQIGDSPGKDTPVDADQVGLVDSADGGLLKKLSWQNIKQTLSNVFVNTSDIVNNLTSEDENKPLSALQGKTLNDGKASKNGSVNEKFSAADGTDSKHVVNKSQLDDKASLSGGSDANFTDMPWVSGSPIVSRGGNSNGQWVRFADGTQICTYTSIRDRTDWESAASATSAVGSTNLSMAFFSSFPYPSSFVGLPIDIVSGGRASSSGALAFWSGRLGQFVDDSWSWIGLTYNSFTASSPISLNLTAIGRWF